MKFEGTVKGEWYQVTGDMFSSTSDFICFDFQKLGKVHYTACIDGGAFENEDGCWSICKEDGDKLTPMTEAQKEEYLPQYKSRGLGWCRTENKYQYIHVTKLNKNFSYYDQYIEEGRYKEESDAWVINNTTYACPLSEDEIDEFITPHLPKDRGLHVPEASFIYDESNMDYAKKSYPPGTVVEHLYAANINFTIKEDTIFTEAFDGSVYIQCENTKFWLFEGGVWADIVESLPQYKESELGASIKEFLVGDEPPTLPLEKRVPTVLGGKGVINVKELRAQAKDMALLISPLDMLNWKLPTIKRGSEIIEIFLRK